MLLILIGATLLGGSVLTDFTNIDLNLVKGSVKPMGRGPKKMVLTSRMYTDKYGTVQQDTLRIRLERARSGVYTLWMSLSWPYLQDICILGERETAETKDICDFVIMSIGVAWADLDCDGRDEILYAQWGPGCDDCTPMNLYLIDLQDSDTSDTSGINLEKGACGGGERVIITRLHCDCVSGYILEEEPQHIFYKVGGNGAIQPECK